MFKVLHQWKLSTLIRAQYFCDCVTFQHGRGTIKQRQAHRSGISHILVFTLLEGLGLGLVLFVFILLEGCLVLLCNLPTWEREMSATLTALHTASYRQKKTEFSPEKSSFENLLEDCVGSKSRCLQALVEGRCSSSNLVKIKKKKRTNIVLPASSPWRPEISRTPILYWVMGRSHVTQFITLSLSSGLLPVTAKQSPAVFPLLPFIPPLHDRHPPMIPLFNPSCCAPAVAPKQNGIPIYSEREGTRTHIGRPLRPRNFPPDLACSLHMSG